MSVVQSVNNMNSTISDIKKSLDLYNKKDIISIKDLSAIKNTYVKLLWISQNINLMQEQICTMTEKYGDLMKPLSDIKNISKKYDDWCDMVECENLSDQLNEISGKDLISTDDFTENAPSEEEVNYYKYIYGDREIYLPIVKSLSDIPQNIYYYYGDDSNKKGLYTRIGNNVVVEIPINVDVVSENIEMKHYTIKCSDGKNCTKWKCSFQHPGGEYKKIGYKARCPSRPGFSNPRTFSADSNLVTYEDMRICLMYNLTDIFSIMMWFNKFGNCNHIMKDIQICDEYTNPFSKKEVK